MRERTYALLAILAMTTAGAQAVFIVEADPSGLANENFSGTPTYSVTYPLGSKAPGCTAGNNAYGSTTPNHVYVYHYTPGADVDNWRPTAGTDLTNNHRASGLVGGVPGLYNVYFTTVRSTNVTGKANFTVTSEGDDVIVENLDMNTGGTGTPGANDGWYRLANRVRMITGRTYTVTQAATNTSAVSMRSHGIMWELVDLEEPVATIVETDGVTSVEENGVVDAYSIVLSEPPSAAVIVTAEVFEPNVVAVNGAQMLELRFTPDDWNIPQIVNVVAEKDSIAEPETAVWIMHMTRLADPNFADPVYDDAYAGLVTAYVRDNNVPHVMVKETDHATAVSEHGGADTYTMELLYAPTDDVTIAITADAQTRVNTGAGPAKTAQLLFTPADYSVAQTVTVTAVDDGVLEGEHKSVIVHAGSSLDAGYDAIPVREIHVSVSDNECGAWGYMPLDLNEDCVVNLADLAEFAVSWLDCTTPYAEDCRDLR